jgi:ABC-type transporter Mla subunit MlaD
MPSSSDFMNKLNDIQNVLNTVNNTLNAKLTDIKNATDAVRASTDQVRGAVQHVDSTLTTGLNSLINIGNYTNQALFENAKQNETIICILEHISKNTCAILNEAHAQTKLQKSMERSAGLLAELYAVTHADAMLTHERMAALKRQIEECCPPKPESPPCSYEPCPEPKRLPEPKPENTIPKGSTQIY